MAKQVKMNDADNGEQQAEEAFGTVGTIDYAQMAAEMEQEETAPEEAVSVEQFRPGNRQKFKINFAEDSSFEVIPNGQVHAKATQVEVRKSKSSDYPYLNITYEIHEDNEFGNRKVWHSASLSPKALWRTKKVFQAHRIDVDNIENMEVNEANMLVYPDLTEHEVVLELGQEQNQGDRGGMRNVVLEVYDGDFEITNPVESTLAW